MASFLVSSLAAVVSLLASPAEAKADPLSYSNNYYVLFSLSWYYKNYRHSLDTAFYYEYLRERNIPDSQIMLLYPFDHACNPKTPFPGHLYNSDYKKDWVCESTEVDFKGDDLLPQSVVDALRDRYDPGYTLNKRMTTTEDSRIFMFFNGHGVDSTIKLQQS